MSVQYVETQDAKPRRLVRSLTLIHAVLYGLGVTIGAGIYVLVGIAAERSGMMAPLAFIGAALVMVLSAASFAELGTRMPVSASEAAYVEAAFQRKWLSLIVGLLVVVTATISAATISVGSAGYVAVFLSLPTSRRGCSDGSRGLSIYRSIRHFCGDHDADRSGWACAAHRRGSLSRNRRCHPPSGIRGLPSAICLLGSVSPEPRSSRSLHSLALSIS